MADKNNLIGDLISTAKTRPDEKYRRHDPLVWVLSNDLNESARWLSDKYLDKSIKNAVQILLCTKYYQIGIRNGRLFNIYFVKGNLNKDINVPDPLRDLIYDIVHIEGKFVFRFINYDSHIAKWARKCKENCKFIEDVLLVYLQEHIRRGKPHKLNDVGLYLISTIPASERLPSNKTGKRMLYEPKNIPQRFLKGLKLNEDDIWKGYRRHYAYRIKDISLEYRNSKADIPEWLINDVV